MQAPQRRAEPLDPKRRRILIAVIAGVVVLGAAAGAIAMAVRGDDEQAALAGSSCKLQTFADQLEEKRFKNKSHFMKVPKDFEYNSFPPTSGPHHPEPAVWDAYDRPVPQLHLIHNLEHGGIVVQYGDGVSQATVNKILGWYREDPNGMIVAPLAKLENKIALTAWTHLATCSRFDEEAFSSFRDLYRFKGPERFPEELLTPGSQ